MKYTGDGVLALLRRLPPALDTARSIREQLAKRGLHIRTGVHVGDVDVRGDDVSGLTVNVAARIMNRAEAGETLVSDSVRQATLGSSFSFDDIGAVQLKGIPEQFTAAPVAVNVEGLGYDSVGLSSGRRSRSYRSLP